MTYIIKNSIYRIVVLSVLMCPPVQMNGHMDSTGHIKMNLKGKKYGFDTRYRNHEVKTAKKAFS